MSLLSWIPVVTLVGALLALVAGTRSAAVARVVALLTALFGAVAAGVAAAHFAPSNELVTLVDLPWITQLGIRYHLAVDGISLSLVVLTALAATSGILFSWTVAERVGEFFALYLTLVAGVYGVFLSADAFLFFVFYEIAIVPKYFLVAGWGSTRREYGAMKLVLYSFAGSALVLAGLVWTYGAGGAEGFSFGALTEAASRMSYGENVAAFGLVFFGFATLAGLFPLHTWAPTGHVAAPTGASMLLAGVVMKLGAYGCLRIALPFYPVGFAAWQLVIGWLAVAGIVYAGLVALVQRDFKFVIGYSSVSHMGFVMLGLATGEIEALAGATLQMFSHGVIAGLLFGVVGRMVYEREHTRDLLELEARPMHRRLPGAAAVFVLAGLASMGLPGFSGFPAELKILVGAWNFHPIWAVAAAVGVLVAGAFTLRVMQRAFFGQFGAAVGSAAGAEPGEVGERLSVPEKLGAGLLLAATIVIGLKPDLLLDWIMPALQSPAFHFAATNVVP